MLKINNIDASNGISINRYVSGIWLEQCRKNIEKFSENIKNNANSLPQDQHLDNLSLKN